MPLWSLHTAFCCRQSPDRSPFVAGFRSQQPPRQRMNVHSGPPALHSPHLSVRRPHSHLPLDRPHSQSNERWWGHIVSSCVVPLALSIDRMNCNTASAACLFVGTPGAATAHGVLGRANPSIRIAKRQEAEIRGEIVAWVYMWLL